MKFLDSYIPDIYLTRRALFVLLAIVILLILGFAYPIFYALGKGILLLYILSIIAELFILYTQKSPYSAKRIAEQKLSNGDYNPVIVTLESNFPYKSRVRLIEEFPAQLQIRDKVFNIGQCDPYFKKDIDYEIRPVTRGNYAFGDIRIFTAVFLQLIERRVTVLARETMVVYPSFIKLRRFSFYAISNRLDEAGVKKIRQLGSSNEFEQIRDYVRGDDFRKINWNATARKGELMVNEYQEERSQNVYCLIDTGRTMQMPFNGLPLVEYSVNAALVMLGIARAKSDRPGLIAFSKKVDTILKASAKPVQMQRIIDSLYNLESQIYDSDFFELYRVAKLHIKKRSLLLIFTNFNTISGLSRQLKFIRAMARDHLVCVIFFDNTEISDVANQKVFGLNQAYNQTIAEKYTLEKRLLIKELRKNGIYSILTKPEDLTVNTINQYISFKATGAI